MYNYNHLYYFYITAKSGGVNAAVKHLHISQPSLSSQLKALERALEVRLFQKVGRKNQLTLAGSVVYGYCRQMFELSAEMSEQISKQIPTSARRIHIGVSDEIDRQFATDVVSLFLKNHGLAQRPNVTIVSGEYEQLADRLRFREIDAVLTQQAMIDPELENLERAEIPVALTYPSKWPVRPVKGRVAVAATVAAVQEGDRAQWIMPAPRSKLRSEIDLFFEIHHLKGHVVFESDITASIVRAVKDGMGLAFLPTLFMQREIEEDAVRIICPRGGYWKYRIWFASHTQNKNDVLVEALARSFKEICGHGSK